MNYEHKCPIWATPAEKQNLSKNYGTKDVNHVNGYAVISPRVGQYKITKSAHDIIGRLGVDDSLKARLTTWIVNQNRHGVEWPEIDSDILKSIESQRPMAVHERADRLLKLIAEKSKRLGQQFNFYPTFESDTDIDLFKLLAASESHDQSEISYLLNFLEESKLLNQVGNQEGRDDYVITPAGYARLSSLETKNQLSHQAFVAMWFDPSMNEAYEKGLAAGIRKAGYEPIKIDNKQHNNKIDDEIIAEIRRSRFLVADFTQGENGARGGVYYEAGFAHGLNIPVIFTCSKVSINQVHFDTRQYNHIAWIDYNDLRDRLAQRISATIGDGPLSKKLVDPGLS